MQKVQLQPRKEGEDDVFFLSDFKKCHERQVATAKENLRTAFLAIKEIAVSTCSQTIRGGVLHHLDFVEVKEEDVHHTKDGYDMDEASVAMRMGSSTAGKLPPGTPSVQTSPINTGTRKLAAHPLSSTTGRNASQHAPINMREEDMKWTKAATTRSICTILTRFLRVVHYLMVDAMHSLLLKTARSLMQQLKMESSNKIGPSTLVNDEELIRTVWDKLNPDQASVLDVRQMKTALALSSRQRKDKLDKLAMASSVEVAGPLGGAEQEDVGVAAAVDSDDDYNEVLLSLLYELNAESTTWKDFRHSLKDKMKQDKKHYGDNSPEALAALKKGFKRNFQHVLQDLHVDEHFIEVLRMSKTAQNLFNVACGKGEQTVPFLHTDIFFNEVETRALNSHTKINLLFNPSTGLIHSEMLHFLELNMNVLDSIAYLMTHRDILTVTNGVEDSFDVSFLTSTNTTFDPEGNLSLRSFVMHRLIMDHHYRKIGQEIDQKMSTLDKSMQQFAHSYDDLLEKYIEDKVRNFHQIKPLYERGFLTLDSLKNDVGKYKAQMESILAIEDSVDMHLVRVCTTTFKELLLPAPRRCLDELGVILPLLSREQCERILNSISDNLLRLERTPGNLHDFVDHLKHLNELSFTQDEDDKNFNAVCDLHDLVVASDFNVPSEDEANHHHLMAQFSRLRTAQELALVRRDELIQKYRIMVKNELVQLKKDIKRLAEESQKDLVTNPASSADTAALFTNRLWSNDKSGMPDVQKCEDKARRLVEYQEQFNRDSTKTVPVEKVEEVESVSTEIRLKRLLWTNMQSAEKSLRDWRATDLGAISVSEMAAMVQNLEHVSTQVSEVLPSSAVVTRMQGLSRQINDIFPMVESLQNKALCRRHWAKIGALTNSPVITQLLASKPTVLGLGTKASQQQQQQGTGTAAGTTESTTEGGDVASVSRARTESGSVRFADNGGEEKSRANTMASDTSTEDATAKNLAAQAVDPNAVFAPSIELGKLLDAGASNVKEDIANISHEASAENALEDSLLSVSSLWKNKSFQFEVMKDSGGREISHPLNLEDVAEVLQDSQMLVNSIAQSPHVGPISHAVNKWCVDLSLIHEGIDRLSEVWELWGKLEPVYSSPDLQRVLNTHGKRWLDVDRQWRQLVEKAVEAPRLLAFCLQPHLLDKLEYLFSECELLKKKLQEYLHIKRQSFPRFFFVSEEPLLRILVTCKDPLEVNEAHLLRYCFDNIGHIVFGKRSDAQDASAALDVLGVHSEGTRCVEKMDLGRNLKARGYPDYWLGQIEKRLIDVIRKSCKMSIFDLVTRMSACTDAGGTSGGSVDEKAGVISAWILQFNSGQSDFGIKQKKESIKQDTQKLLQTALVAYRALWTKEVGDILQRSGGGGGGDSATDVIAPLEQLQSMYGKCVDLLTGRLRTSPLSPLQLQLTTMTTMFSLNFRDTLGDMIADRKVLHARSSDEDFDWHGQFRVTLEDNGGLREDDVRVQHLGSKFQYLYNYQGTNIKMVLTPKTERVLHALARSLGGNSTGAAMMVQDRFTGRSYATQLAELFAWPIFEVQATSDCTEASVLRLLQGVQQYGSLLLLQRMFTVSGQVMSVLASELAQIYTWTDRLQPHFGDNTGGGGASNTTQFGIVLGGLYNDPQFVALPSSVSRFFRPVAVARPGDVDMFRCILISHGFQNAGDLAMVYCKVRSVMTSMFAQQCPWFGLPNATQLLKALCTKWRSDTQDNVRATSPQKSLRNSSTNTHAGDGGGDNEPSGYYQNMLAEYAYIHEAVLACAKPQLPAMEFEQFTEMLHEYFPAPDPDDAAAAALEREDEDEQYVVPQTIPRALDTVLFRGERDDGSHRASVFDWVMEDQVRENIPKAAMSLGLSAGADSPIFDVVLNLFWAMRQRQTVGESFVLEHPHRLIFLYWHILTDELFCTGIS
jgi:hypothetical protein